MPNALDLLRQDHNMVKDLFQRFEKTEERSKKKQIAEEAIMNLVVHAQIEEEIFYPAMRKQLGDVELLHEAREEHHVADTIMEELQTMKLSDKDYDAKFTVLAENVKHHIGEEEGEMFPKASEAGQKALEKIGDQLMERKQELMEEMQRPQKRRAASGSRNGGSSRSGRTSRTTARSRTTSSSRGGTSKTGRKSTGTRSRSSSGTRSSSARSSGGSRASSTRSRSGGSSRARSSSSGKRSTATKRKSTSRSRR
jgi:hemerythrin superfamily protein